MNWLNINLKSVYGPMKMQGYLVVDGSHKKDKGKDFFYLRFLDDTAWIAYRNGNSHAQMRAIREHRLGNR